VFIWAARPVSAGYSVLSRSRTQVSMSASIRPA
jgi:hypothetical protein